MSCDKCRLTTEFTIGFSIHGQEVALLLEDLLLKLFTRVKE